MKDDDYTMSEVFSAMKEQNKAFKNIMKILSLFDGISALQFALNNCGIKDYKYYASEVDKYAIKVTQKNFPNTVQLGNVKNIHVDLDSDNSSIIYPECDDCGGVCDIHSEYVRGGVDLLSFGFPCQDLSIAKKDRKGLDGERSGLFFEALRILNEVKPKYFLAENVASMSKEMKNLITSHLYGIEPVLLNSSLVTAQQRKRLFWVGKLQEDGTYARVDIPQPQDKGILLKDILESGLPYQEKAHTLTASYNGAVFWNSIEKKQRSMILEPICVASRGRNIIDGKSQNIKGAKTTQRLELKLSGKTNCLTTVQKDNLVLQPIRIGHLNKGGQGDRVYSVQGKCVYLSADGEYNVRKLTPNECARLQGFPDNYTNEISNTQAYKCYGNSFTVPIIEHILKHL